MNLPTKPPSGGFTAHVHCDICGGQGDATVELVSGATQIIEPPEHWELGASTLICERCKTADTRDDLPRIPED